MSSWATASEIIGLWDHVSCAMCQRGRGALAALLTWGGPGARDSLMCPLYMYCFR